METRLGVACFDTDITDCLTLVTNHVCSDANYSVHLHLEKDRSLYQNKVTSYLSSTQKPVHSTCNCKMDC